MVGELMAGSGEPVASEPLASVAVGGGRWSVAGGRSRVAGWLVAGEPVAGGR